MGFFSKADIKRIISNPNSNIGSGLRVNGVDFITHTNMHPSDSAVYSLSRSQKLILFSIIFLCLAFALYDFHLFIVIFIGLLSIVYFVDLLFNLFLIYRSFTYSSEIKVSQSELNSYSDWPTYTVFCPLYKEIEVLPQFVEAMSNLDYPKDRLQVILLLEEDDRSTIDAANSSNLPKFFEILVVPHSLPKTKPKALNYGLGHAKGEVMVIYDAEDIPEVDQLKKAVIAFAKAGDRTMCIQAKLNFYNPRQNILTRLFTSEYSLWFDLVLTGLQSIKAPIPLGGTSNHFLAKYIKELKGWDPFNVTEDCDLGLRIFKKGFHTCILDSTTNEEANSDTINWFWQRTRWIKGYIQTYFVHMRNVSEFMQDITSPHILTFQLVVGGKILSMFINPLMWLTTILYFTFRDSLGPTIETFFPAPVFYISIFSLIFGNFLYIYYYMLGCVKRNYDDLLLYTLFIPLYWLGMSLAATVAVWRYIVAPHHWSKTKHGLHLKKS